MAKFAMIVLFCILGATLSKAFDKEEAMKRFMEFSGECMKEAGATQSDLDDLIKAQPAAGKEGKCMRACILKKYNVMDDSGKFVKAVAIEHAQKVTDNDAGKMKIANEVIDICAAKDVPADACEAAAIYGKCMRDEAVARGISKKDFF